MSVLHVRNRGSATTAGLARHRADRAPALAPSRPFRHAHLDRRRQRVVGLVALAVLMAGSAVGARLLIDERRVNQAVLQGVPTPVPGARTGVAVDTVGDVLVTVEATWPRSPWKLSLSMPLRPDLDFHPRAVLIALQADGAPVPVDHTVGAGETVEIPMPTGAVRTRLDYSATGTYIASTPSVPGRGLVLLTPLEVPALDVPWRLEVTDGRILNLACRSAGLTRACGSNSGDTWTVDDLSAQEDVVAQIDLVSGPQS